MGSTSGIDFLEVGEGGFADISVIMDDKLLITMVVGRWIFGRKCQFVCWLRRRSWFAPRFSLNSEMSLAARGRKDRKNRDLGDFRLVRNHSLTGMRVK